MADQIMTKTSAQQRFPLALSDISHLKIVNRYGHTLKSVKLRLDDTSDVTFDDFDSELNFEFRTAHSSESNHYQDSKRRVWYKKGDKWRVVQSVDFNNGYTGDDLLMPNTSSDFNQYNSIIYHPGNIGAGDDSVIMNLSASDYLPLAYDDDGISGHQAARLVNKVEGNCFIIAIQEGFEWQFHFRNFTQSLKAVTVHHKGGGWSPWHSDSRPTCWHNKELPHCPAGLADGSAVYRPANWVVNFGLWWDLLVDGLKLAIDVGLIIKSPPPTASDITTLVSDILNIDEDIVSLQLSTMSQQELDEMLSKAQESLPSACKSIGVTEEYIVGLAEQMNLKNWAFIAGDSYEKFIYSDDSTVTESGWTVCCGPDGHHRTANHAFVEKGHLIYAITDDDNNEKLWKWIY